MSSVVPHDADATRWPDACWNATGRDVPAATLAALFEAQVTRTPDAVALRFDGEDHSYAGVNATANRLARVLVAHGVGPEHIVAFALPRSVEVVVAMLAVAKAGGAFLPMDLRHPAERIAATLADAVPALVIVPDGELPSGVDGAPATPVSALLAEAATRPDTDLTDDDRLAPLSVGHAAYVIHTSGSTGRPKGVVVTHRGLASLAAAQTEMFLVGQDCRVLQFASLSFDAVVSELCMALTTGATLVLARQEQLAPGAALAELVRAERVTHATLPPAVLPLQCGPDALPAGLALITAGEACPADVAERWAPGRLMINAYGPTECTVCATMTTLPHGDGAPPIGGPITNTRVYVLDDDLRHVPVGAEGELFVAGDGLARGYLRRPGLTATRFVPDPFTGVGARMYRTGDRARWRPDGALDFLGRVDDQIKIRGHRVEPAEIEGALAEDPDVAQARVVLRRDRDRAQLVAYVVPVPGRQVRPVHLTRSVAARLPSYMVPAAVVTMDRLPLNPNGKLDHGALPAPRHTVSDVAPRTPQEELLCQLFSSVLGIPRIGADDNFFELGGDSLLATRLAARVRATFGVELPVATVVAAGTPAGLAKRLGVADAGAALDILLPLRPSGTHAPLFCVHPAGGISWSYGRLLAHVDARHPVYGIQAAGLTGDRRPARDLDEMVEEYLATIRRVAPDGPYHLVGWSFGGLVAHTMAARLRRSGEQVGLLALLDAYPTVPPELRHGGDEAAFLVDMAHFIDLPAGEVGDGPLDRTAVLELARRESSALASLDGRTVERIVEVFAANCALLDGYVPEIYDGDVEFFTATAGTARASAWLPFVRGEVHEHEIDCAHRDMGRAEPMRHIGSVIAACLGQARVRKTA